MAETCFSYSDYILVAGHCGSAVPSTGLYINQDLEGITLQKAANISEGEFNRGVDLLNQCIANGIAKARADIVRRMMQYVRFDAVLESHTFGCFKNDYLSASAGERGVTISLCGDCRYTKLYINQIVVKANTTIADKQVKIVDGATTTTKTVDLTAGVPAVIRPSYSATNKEITIRWDTSGISPNNSDLNSCSDCGCSSGSNLYQTCDGCDNCGCDLVTATGSDGTSNTYGITVYAQAICDEGVFTCDIAKWLARAALYASGISFCIYQMTTNRINAFTIYKEEQYQELRATFEDEYNKEINTLADRLPSYLADVGGDCIKCDSSRWVTSIP